MCECKCKCKSKCKCDCKNSHCMKKIARRIFDKEYAELWSILQDVGPSVNGGAGFSTDLPKPLLFVSKFTGISVLTDPSSPVKILGFDIKNLDGPSAMVSKTPLRGHPPQNAAHFGGGPVASIENGFTIRTFSDASNYKISYKIKNLTGGLPNEPNVKIGFYTSNIFEFNVENILQLITGSRGPPSKCFAFCGGCPREWCL